MSILTSCTTETYMPVFGQQCYSVETGQENLNLTDTLLASYEPTIVQYSGFKDNPLPVNRIFKSDSLTSIVLVSLDNDPSKVNNYWLKQKGDKISNQREDKSGFHYTFFDSLHHYMFIQKNNSSATVLFWEITSDSSNIMNHYNDSTYYPNKFQCKE